MIGYLGILSSHGQRSFDRFINDSSFHSFNWKIPQNVISRQRLKQKVPLIDKLPIAFPFLMMTVGLLSIAFHKTDVGIEPFKSKDQIVHIKRITMY